MQRQKESSTFKACALGIASWFIVCFVGTSIATYMYLEGSVKVTGISGLIALLGFFAGCLAARKCREWTFIKIVLTGVGLTEIGALIGTALAVLL